MDASAGARDQGPRVLVSGSGGGDEPRGPPRWPPAPACAGPALLAPGAVLLCRGPGDPRPRVHTAQAAGGLLAVFPWVPSGQRWRGWPCGAQGPFLWGGPAELQAPWALGRRPPVSAPAAGVKSVAARPPGASRGAERPVCGSRAQPLATSPRVTEGAAEAQRGGDPRPGSRCPEAAARAVAAPARGQ